MNQDIVNVIKAYEKSLNASDAQAALNLYGEDPIFMPQYSVALSGRDAHGQRSGLKVKSEQPTINGKQVRGFYRADYKVRAMGMVHQILLSTRST